MPGNPRRGLVVRYFDLAGAAMALGVVRVAGARAAANCLRVRRLRA